MKLTDLFGTLNIRSSGIAVELNKQVIAKENWPSMTLSDGDQIEIVHFVGGGSLNQYEELE